MHYPGYILSLCDASNVMLQPWAAAGWTCVAVDVAYETVRLVNGVRQIPADVRCFEPPEGPIHRAFAWPPCTDLARSGARWWQDKGPAALTNALEIADACRRLVKLASGGFVENPIGRLVSAWGPPTYRFHPYHYAGRLADPGPEAGTKCTCLWAFGAFVMPDHRPVLPVRGSLVHNTPDTARRAALRSVTPAGFARAVYLANCVPDLLEVPC